jgi:hypothetical protein
MLYIRKLKPTINKPTEGKLFTLIIRNVKLETSTERDIQIYLKKSKNKNSKTYLNTLNCEEPEGIELLNYPCVCVLGGRGEFALAREKLTCVIVRYQLAL